MNTELGTRVYRGELLICSSAMPKTGNMISGYALVVCEITDTTLVTKKNYKESELDEMTDVKVWVWQLDNIKAIEPILYKKTAK